MAAVRVRELDELLVRLIVAADHPEITAVRLIPSQEHPDNHTRLRVDFASGACAYLMVGQVSGRGVGQVPRYQIPPAVL
ncbi:hypothetical protein LX83_002937 [Goodfellowiella coeruleoviolacea]|uniref:Uncharacterized protein n=2 Tax=Goodfellowiella coeruleoviolacea TaxID=334858 RepID=A0AAE3GH79_9PSEU|nr:hypothetical protein [Goodfellowiella coeruleoviolacea]